MAGPEPHLCLAVRQKKKPAMSMNRWTLPAASKILTSPLSSSGTVIWLEMEVRRSTWMLEPLGGLARSAR